MWSSLVRSARQSHKPYLGLIALSLLAFNLLAPALAGEPRSPSSANESALAQAAPPSPPAAGGEKAVQAPGTAPVPEGAGETKLMRVVYVGKEYPEPLPLSYAEKPITDKGIQGARLMLKEANQAGNFIGHSFELVEAIVPEDGDVVAKAKEVLKDGDTFILADLEPADLLAVADLPEAKNSVVMNIRTSATSLRQEQCRSNVFHVIPDYAMRRMRLPSISFGRNGRVGSSSDAARLRTGTILRCQTGGCPLRRQGRLRPHLCAAAGCPQSRFRSPAGASTDSDGDAVGV